MKKSSLSWIPIATALALSCVIVPLAFCPPFNTIEKRLYDLSFQIRGIEEPNQDIVIIAITDENLKAVGVWPWPRGYHASLLNILDRVKPSVVFFDMILSEASRPDQDELFSQAIKKAGNVILSYYFPSDSPKDLSLKEPEGLPIDAFQKYAKSSGYVNIFPDPDGNVREIILKHEKDGKTYLHNTLAVAKAHRGWADKELERFPAEKGFLINFPGPYQNFRIIPFDYLIRTFPFTWAKSIHEALRGKVLLVGHTATGTAMDLKPTPFSRQYPGVGILASMLHTILSGRFIHRVPWEIHVPLLFLFLLLVTGITKQTKPLQGFLYNSAALVIMFEIIQILFKYFLIWLPYGTFLGGASLLYLTYTLLSFIQIHFEREVMSRELSLASRIQKNLLPTEIPLIGGLGMAALSLPARHVGGDLYDLLTLPEGKCGICIGDVSGKGVPAALFMAKSISEFRREAGALEPSVVITNVNKKLSEGGFTGLFITVLYVIVDPANKKITFANGGHEPILHYQKKNRQVTLLQTELGGPLGIDAEGVFDQKEAAVEIGDFLILESDGVKEAMNSKNEIFGFERLQAAMIEASEKDPQGIIDHIKRRIDEFVKQADQHDDLTMVCAKFL